MARVVAEMSMSLDGFIADPPDDGPRVIEGNRVTHVFYRVVAG